MTDLVAELRKRAEAAALNPRLASPQEFEARRLALLEASDLLEADPLYKAAPALREALDLTLGYLRNDADRFRTIASLRAGERVGGIADVVGRFERLLATVPKEVAT